MEQWPPGTYHYSLSALLPEGGGWLGWSIRSSGTGLYDAVIRPSHPGPAAFAAIAAGRAFTFLLGALRLRFWWRPLHPVGFVAANVWRSQWWYMPLFVGWLLKTATIRYGGLWLHQRVLPMAIGVIGGDGAGEVLWALIQWGLRAQQ